MSFTFAFNNTPEYLLITLKGVIETMDEALAVHHAAGEYIASISATCVLVDERALLYNFSKNNMLVFAKKLPLDYLTVKKFAVVGSREDTNRRDLFAGLAWVQNFRICPFEDIEEAHAWLTNPI